MLQERRDWRRNQRIFACMAVAACGVWSAHGRAASTGPTLWIDDTAGNVGTVDVRTGVVTVIGNSGVTLTDIAFDPSGNLWGIDFFRLYRLNRDTGQATTIGLTGVPGGNALVFGIDGTLYAGGNATTGLYTIDTVTGDATSIGDVGFRSAGDLAFNQGQLYLSSTTNRLINIQLSQTVSGTDVGPFGFSNVFGMATGDDSVMYGVAGTRVFSVDRATGVGTQTVDYAGHGLGSANGTSFVVEAVPEPSACGILAAGAALWASRRRRHSR
jgi:hypothetical protein